MFGMLTERKETKEAKINLIINFDVMTPVSSFRNALLARCVGESFDGVDRKQLEFMTITLGFIGGMTDEFNKDFDAQERWEAKIEAEWIEKYNQFAQWEINKEAEIKELKKGEKRVLGAIKANNESDVKWKALQQWYTEKCAESNQKRMARAPKKWDAADAWKIFLTEVSADAYFRVIITTSIDPHLVKHYLANILLLDQATLTRLTITASDLKKEGDCYTVRVDNKKADAEGVLTPASIFFNNLDYPGQQTYLTKLKNHCMELKMDAFNELLTHKKMIWEMDDCVVVKRVLKDYTIKCGVLSKERPDHMRKHWRMITQFEAMQKPLSQTMVEISADAAKAKKEKRGKRDAKAKAYYNLFSEKEEELTTLLLPSSVVSKSKK